MTGSATISTSSVQVQAAIVFLGNTLQMTGWISPENGDFELCTSASSPLDLAPLPAGAGSACLGTTGIKVKLDVSVNGTLAGLLTTVTKVARKVLNKVKEWVTAERNCKWYDAWCWANKFFSYVVDKVIEAIEYVEEKIEKALSIGVKVNAKLDATWNWGSSFSLNGQLSGTFVWPGGSHNLGTVGVSFNQGGFTLDLPSPIPDFCVRTRPLAVKVGTCK